MKDELFKDKKINYLYTTKYMEKKPRKFLTGKPNKKIAFICASGPIYEGESKTPDAFDDSLHIGCDTVSRQLRRATEDKNVIGIILRVKTF